MKYFTLITKRALTERLRVVRLIDAYGPLLTAHQQRLLRLYYLDDLSLGEIAARSAVSRQAVFDALRRSVAELKRMEAALQVVRDRESVASRLEHLADAIHGLKGRTQATALARVTGALAALRRAAR